METLKRTLFSHWNFMRWFRLAIGIFIAFQAFQQHSELMWLLSALFIFQALSNTGCCGASGCAVPTRKTKSEKVKDVEFVEAEAPKKDNLI
jgi:hypothetical protein